MTTTLKLPPSERDFNIFEAVHLQGCSTWHMADRYRISQTRVRQLIERVTLWLAEMGESSRFQTGQTIAIAADPQTSVSGRAEGGNPAAF